MASSPNPAADDSAGGSRGLISLAFMVLAGILLAGTLLSGFTKAELVNPERFAERTVQAAADSPVRERLAEEITDDAIQASGGDLVAFRPLIQVAVREAIGSPPVGAVLRTAVADLHRTVVSGREDTATVLISDLGLLVAGALERSNPELVRRIPTSLDSRLSLGSLPPELAKPIEHAKGIAALFYPLLFGTFACFGLALAVAPSRRRTLGQFALTLIGVGVLISLFSWLAQARAISSLPGGMTSDLIGAGIRELAGDLRIWALGVAGFGVILSAALRSWIRPLDLRSRLAMLWEAVTRPAGSVRGEAVRGLTLVGLGVLLIVGRSWLQEVILTLAGLGIGLIGLEQIFRLLSAGDRAEAPTVERERRITRRRGLAIGGAATLAVVLLGGGLFATGAVTPPDRIISGKCNGHRELCDRSVDQVAFATTHNSMSGADVPGFMFAQQEKGIPGQAKDGIRGLMIDAYFGRKVSRGVRTEMDRGKVNQELERLFGVEGSAAAERTRDRLIGGGTPGPRKAWLCHGVCEVGAVPMSAALTSIREFLVLNPGEVLVITIQDEGVPPDAVATLFRESGLLPFVYRQPLDRGFPTLGEMVETNRRVLVFAENDHDPAIGWYHRAFEYTQETPFHFTSPDQMNCRPNRGPADAPLFLINNWIDTTPAPRPSNARRVNSNPFLQNRVEECQKKRDAFPNFVAVDFYRQGDLFGVIDDLNGVG